MGSLLLNPNLPHLLLAAVMGGFVLGGPAAGLAQPVLCYEGFDPVRGTCQELLGDGVSAADCCLNQRAAFQLQKDGPCQACRPAAWGEWSPWSPCSVSCGEGTRQRRQRCIGREECDGSAERSRWELNFCTDRECCPVMGGWTAWSSWAPCSVTCLKGVQSRQRSCTAPVPICGGTCPGTSTENRACDTNQVCPTHGSWGSWGAWGPCAATCTVEGSSQKPTQLRQRQCNSPAPSSNPPGNRCPGSDRDEQPCTGLPYCPVNGNWGAWKPASSCSVTCGVGKETAVRSCDNPAPRYGGKGCSGDSRQTHTCNTGVPCPVDGHWEEWSEWDTCIRRTFSGRITCEEIVGQQKRTRRCLGRTDGGKRCDGTTMELRSCYNIKFCKMNSYWSEWSPWSLCTPPCGEKPVRSRKRECLPQYPNYAMTTQPVEGGPERNITFWGKPRVMCERLEGQDVEQTVECQNVLRCED